STGRELSLPHDIPPAAIPRHAAVIGAGPAGLEAARVLAERGHTVELFEASDRVGGQLRLAAMAPRRRDLQGIIDWRVSELARLGVPVHINTYIEADQIAGGPWNLVIVATGGIPAAANLPGGELVVDTWDVLSGAKRLAGHVLLYDENGANPALDAVEALLR